MESEPNGRKLSENNALDLRARLAPPLVTILTACVMVASGSTLCDTVALLAFGLAIFFVVIPRLSLGLVAGSQLLLPILMWVGSRDPQGPVGTGSAFLMLFTLLLWVMHPGPSVGKPDSESS